MKKTLIMATLAAGLFCLAPAHAAQQYATQSEAAEAAPEDGFPFQTCPDLTSW